MFQVNHTDLAMWKFLLIGHFLIAGAAHPNFTDNCEGKKVNGAKHGHWKCYYEGGKVQQEGEYINDMKSGHWKFYHASGNIALEGNYEADQETGKWIVYDEAGNQIDEIDYGN